MKNEDKTKVQLINELEELRRRVAELEPEAFDENEVRLLEELGDDFMYGIISLRLIEEHKRAETRIRHSKELLQSVFDGFLEPVLLLDADLLVKMLNRPAKEYYHVLKYQDAIDRPCYKGLMKQTKPCVGCKIFQTISNEGAETFERKGFVDPSRVEKIIIYPLKIEGNKKKGAIVRICDITEEKRIEEQLIRADRLSSLGQLSGGIAHEIRNPLAGISLFTDILIDEENFRRTEDEMGIFNDIKGNINQIDGIIKRVLHFAKPPITSSSRVNINALIRENVKLWSAKLRESNIKLELSLKEDLPRVNGDSVGLQQAINNMVLNAIESMEKQGVLAIATFKRISSFHSSREMVIIKVKDTGPGIDSEYVQSVFNPFFTTKANGTGLGLAISHQIVKRHGGTISLNSLPGEETTFTIELPAMIELPKL